jgi:hypothetical protein
LHARGGCCSATSSAPARTTRRRLYGRGFIGIRLKVART